MSKRFHVEATISQSVQCLVKIKTDKYALASGAIKHFNEIAKSISVIPRHTFPNELTCKLELHESDSLVFTCYGESIDYKEMIDNAVLEARDMNTKSRSGGGR